jgi:transcriptional regulator with XRE-family HTH domain
VGEPPVVTFGGLLRRLRREAGLTQEELAERAGVSARTVSDLEREVALTPRNETARLLADALNLTGAARESFETVARGRAAPPGGAEFIGQPDAGRAGRRGAASMRITGASAAAVLLITGVAIGIGFATRGGATPPSPRPPTVGSSGQSSAPSPANAPPIAASFPAPGSGTDALAFDGKDLWTSDNSDSIFQVDVNGQVDASYQSPDPTPEGITWDGHSFWVFTTNQLLIDHFQIRNGHVERLGSVNPHAQEFGGGITHNLAWDHGDLWWAEQYNVKLLTARGAVVRQITKGSDVVGLAWDGRHLWLAYDNFPDGSRIEENSPTGTPLATFTVPIAALTSLVWADGTLWASGQHDLAGPTWIYRLNLPRA